DRSNPARFYCLEAEKNEEWMVSPERQAKLTTLKEESSFKLQTYIEDRRPEKLFQETNGDSQYRIDNTASLSMDDTGNKQDRTQIIRSQAPRKNRLLKEQWSSLENLEFSKTPKKLMEGFSLSYRGSDSPKDRPVPAEQGAIDHEQIDFNAARKQFLMMEQLNKSAPLFRRSLQLSLTPTKERNPLPSPATVKDDTKYRHMAQSQSPQNEQKEADIFTFNLSENTPDAKVDQRETDDSGLSTQSRPAPETPIEREIRIAQEREESLRRARGIKHSDSTEMVEIKTKPLLSQAMQPMKAVKAKDTNRVSFLIQREFEMENKRKEHLDKLQGPYTCGTLQELGERKKIFEPQREMSPVSSVTCLIGPALKQIDNPQSQARDPWGNQKPSSPGLPRVSALTGSEGVGTPAQKGLTETLLEDFEERRARLRLEESAYAGIQPTDDVNNEVLEATRVTRHKNMRALRWEAGVYANEDMD
uniref:A-kinase anchor protein 2 C-terminal domain-containing protein n=1 Tax=Denticeps clupeoides TaxID=299321 RepID=A0AAY4EQ12_9TELE